MLLARNREKPDRWTGGEQTQRHRKTNVGVKCKCIERLSGKRKGKTQNQNAFH